MRARRCSKLAGLGDLSALWVLKRRTRRCGRGSCVLRRAARARALWAMEGGLKEESRMKRVFGWEESAGEELVGTEELEEGFTVRMTWKRELEDANDLRADSREGSKARVFESRLDMSAVSMVLKEWIMGVTEYCSHYLDR